MKPRSNPWPPFQVPFPSRPHPSTPVLGFLLKAPAGDRSAPIFGLLQPRPFQIQSLQTTTVDLDAFGLIQPCAAVPPSPLTLNTWAQSYLSHKSRPSSVVPDPAVLGLRGCGWGKPLGTRLVAWRVEDAPKKLENVGLRMG